MNDNMKLFQDILEEIKQEFGNNSRIEVSDENGCFSFKLVKTTDTNLTICTISSIFLYLSLSISFILILNFHTQLLKNSDEKIGNSNLFYSSLKLLGSLG